MNVPYRDRSQSMVGGVCVGLADYFAVSRGITRLLFVLWALASRSAFLMYALLWILLPVQGEAIRSHEEQVRDGIEEMRSEVQILLEELRHSLDRPRDVMPGNRRAWVVGGVLVAIGLLLLAENLGLWDWLRLGRLWPVVLILAGLVMIGRVLRK